MPLEQFIVKNSDELELEVFATNADALAFYDLAEGDTIETIEI